MAEGRQIETEPGSPATSTCFRKLVASPESLTSTCFRKLVASPESLPCTLGICVGVRVGSDRALSSCLCLHLERWEYLFASQQQFGDSQHVMPSQHSVGVVIISAQHSCAALQTNLHMTRNQAASAYRCVDAM